jgi:hypothetical protein
MKVTDRKYWKRRQIIEETDTGMVGWKYCLSLPHQEAE